MLVCRRRPYLPQEGPLRGSLMFEDVGAVEMLRKDFLFLNKTAKRQILEDLCRVAAFFGAPLNVRDPWVVMKRALKGFAKLHILSPTLSEAVKHHLTFLLEGLFADGVPAQSPLGWLLGI